MIFRIFALVPFARLILSSHSSGRPEDLEFSYRPEIAGCYGIVTALNAGGRWFESFLNLLSRIVTLRSRLDFPAACRNTLWAASAGRSFLLHRIFEIVAPLPKDD